MSSSRPSRALLSGLRRAALLAGSMGLALGLACLTGGSTNATAPSSESALAESSSSATLVAQAPTANGVAARPVTELPSFADLAQRLIPAVVSIQTVQKAKVSRAGPGLRNRGNPHGGPEFFDPFRFFGEGAPEQHGKGLGSGFVIDATGLILTNFHVVEDADEITVSVAAGDGTDNEVKATVVGTAPEYDVALIKTAEPVKVQAAPLGNSDQIRIGDWVMAIGTPFGLTHSVSVGIISAKERRELAPSGRNGLYDFLQTDASINPGNSGGPLVNIRGEVIGINAAINAQGQGIGFAIPINMAKDMLPQLKKGGKFQRSWIGVRIQPLTPELAQSYGLSKSHGVLVAEVVDGSPAQRAGLAEGDIITEFDGKHLVRSSDLPLFASMAGVGKSVKLKVLRERKEKEYSLKLEAFPDDEAQARSGDDGSAEEGGTDMGLALGEVTPDARDRLGLESKKGALVQDVQLGSAAGKAGLRPGDVILRVNGIEVVGPKDAVRVFKAAKSGDILRIQVERQGSRLFVAAKKP